MRAHTRFITRITLHRYATAYAVAIALIVIAAPAYAEDYVANGRFHQFREGRGPITVPTGGHWYPESWRIAPGPGSAVARLYVPPVYVSDGYGLALYIKFSGYNPFAEAGQTWLEQHLFEYDAMIGQTLRFTWWQKVDGCCVGVVPMLMVNYHNGDYEFVGGGGQYLLSDADFTVGVLRDPAGYKARLRAAHYCTATTVWQECSIVFVLPSGVGHTIDNNRYVLLNLNFRGPTAPGIHIAHVQLEVE